MKLRRTFFMILALALAGSFAVAQSSHAQREGRGGDGGRGDDGAIAGGGGGAGGVPEPFSMEIVSRWGGPVNDVEVVGNTAYIGSGSRFVVLNVANPASITEVGSVDLVVPVMDVEIRDQVAYVSTVIESGAACITSFGFCSVNISDPAHPSLISYDLDTFALFEPRDVQLYANIAYVTGKTGGVDLFDISGPAVNSLGQLSNYVPHPGFNPGHIRIVDNLLYISAGSIGMSLRIYSLQPDPLHPVLMGEVAYPDLGGVFTYTMYSLDVSNGVAAIAGKVNELPHPQRKVVMFFDVSTPSAPVFKSVYNQFGQTNTNVTSVDLAGDHAFVTNWTNVPESLSWQDTKGLVILNIEDRANPVEVTSVKTHGSPRGVRVFGNRAYVMDDGEGMIIFDITNPANLQRLGHYHSPASLRDMVKDGNLLYVIDKWNGFTILDVSNSATPQVVGVYQTPNLPAGLNQRIDHRAISVHNDYAYLVSMSFGISVVDVSNPASPQLVNTIPNPVVPAGACNYPTRCLGLAMTGNVLHATWSLICTSPSCPCPWLYRNYDVSNPNLGNIPMLASALMPTTGGGEAPTEMAINADGIAFSVRANVSSVQFIDTGEGNRPPFSNPSLLFNSPLNQCTGVALDGSTLFLASVANLTEESGLYIQDVSNPLSPAPLAYLNFFTQGIKLARAWDVVAANDRAYVFGRAALHPNCANFTNVYVLALDVKNPTQPVVLDYLRVASNGVADISDDQGYLLLDEPHLYSAGGYTGDGPPWLTHDGVTIIQINGIPAPCPADINDDHTVNIDDLVMIITSWGPCLGPPPAPLTVGGPGSGPGSGDMNCDFATNTFDINPFMLALNDWEQYIKDYPDCDLFNGDMNNSGFPIDQADLAIFCPLAGGVLSGGQCLVPVACPADTNGDHVINIDDLVLIITNWGSCE